MHASKQLIPVSLLIRESWQSYVKNFDGLIWIPILPSLILAIGDYLNVFNDPFLKAIGIFMTFIGVVFSILSTLALIYAAHHGKQFNESYRYAEKNFTKYIWVTVIGLLIMVGGLFLLVIPAIFFIIWFSLVGYVFVVEGDRGISALLKSKEYFRGYFWPVVLRLIVAVLIGLIASAIAGSIGSIGGQSGVIACSLVSQILLAPFLVVYELRLYHDLRRLRSDVVGTSVQRNRIQFTLVAIWGVVAPILLGTVLILVSGAAAITQAIIKQ